MGEELPDECPQCGCEDTAFVKYEPNPNDSQTPFARHSPNLFALTCMECGRVHGVVTGEDKNGEQTSDQYRVDGPVD